MTLCDVTTRQLGDVERPETVQCVLPQNVYMEKAFVIVWWWYVMLILITIINFIQWAMRIYISNNNVSLLTTLNDVIFTTFTC